MAWSTRELADLAGTTVRAVRHYHDIGLLEEPHRRSNGYKEYRVAHLVRVLRIKRLTDLGFTLPQIAEIGDADQHPREALRGLDAHLARTLDRLQDVRAEVRQMLRQAAPTDLPPALAARIRDADLSDADHALLVVLTRVLDLAVLTRFVEMLRPLPPSPAAGAFDRLPADADAATRQDLATRLLPPSRTLRVMLPRLRGAGLSPAAARTVDEAVRDLYNPAQFDVLRRVGSLLRFRPAPARPPTGPHPAPDVALPPSSTGVRRPMVMAVGPGDPTGTPGEDVTGPAAGAPTPPTAGGPGACARGPARAAR